MRDWTAIRKNFIYGIVAAVLLSLLWTFTFRNRQADLERMNVKIVVLGDSVMGLCRDETSVVEQLSALLGEQVFNGAMGGTSMTAKPGELGENYGKELLSMVSLSKAIAADDFGAQQTIRTRQAATEYFCDTIDDLECVDFSGVEILLLEYGLNDYHAAVPIDNAEYPMDETTFAGAARSVVTLLRKRYPDMRIIMVTPTYTWYVPREQTCEEYDTGNGYLSKYVDAQIAVAGELGVEIIDLYHEAYTHEAWTDWAVYTMDGLHPNENGRRIIAEILADRLQAAK